MLELAVIGGGPAGLIAAREAARRGIDVFVFEEHQEIGEPERCAGLLSISGLRRLSIPITGKHLQNMVRGAIFHTPTGREYVLDAGRDVAVVVNRKIFDQELAREAEKAGARIFLGTRVKNVLKNGDVVKVLTTKDVHEALWVIDAEGAGSAILRKSLGISPDSSRWIPITQLTVSGHGMDKRYVHLYFKRYLPHFFAYFVPINEDLGKIGVSSKIANLRRMAAIFLKEEFPKAKILKKVSHVIYTGKPIKKLRLSWRIIPVGDAAGHVKATTGGGVIMGGLISAGIASAIAELLRGGDPVPHLRGAERALTELVKIAKFKEFSEKVPLTFYDLVFKIATSQPMKSYLERVGDMDFQLRSIMGGKRAFPFIT